MKLMGTKTEHEYREQLVSSHKSLFEDKEKIKILLFLRSQFPEIKTAYTLDWTPSQGEDIYSILIDRSKVISIEVDRGDVDSDPVLLETLSLSEYENGLSKTNRIKLFVALDLASKDMAIV